MSWAKHARQKLSEGETVQIRPRGDSMTGKVEDGDLVTLEPIKDASRLKVDDIVLVTVKGRDYLHFVKAKRGPQFLIGNNKGGTNGWVRAHAIHGKAVKIER